MFERNSLDQASSPYLLQHKGNPVHWQEWNKETLRHAKKENKLIFVSIGYATCHWCHVMAAEAFSDKEVAKYLNTNFVSIKVDREQRPDIDHYFMAFITQTTGQGGWPLNIFLSPDGKPLTALTYAPLEPKHGMPAFIEILKSVKNADHNPADFIPREPAGAASNYEKVLHTIVDHYDAEYGGFGFWHEISSPQYTPVSAACRGEAHG